MECLNSIIIDTGFALSLGIFNLLASQFDLTHFPIARWTPPLSPLIAKVFSGEMQDAWSYLDVPLFPSTFLSPYACSRSRCSVLRGMWTPASLCPSNKLHVKGFLSSNRPFFPGLQQQQLCKPDSLKDLKISNAKPSVFSH